jgi:hypothetical protein
VRKVITTATDAERPLYLPGGRMVWAQRTTWGFQLVSAGRPCAGESALESDSRPGVCFRSLTRRPARFPPMCWPTGAFCLKPASLSARDRRRNCFWFTPTAQALSRTAAITAGALGRNAVGLGRCGVHARRFAGAVYFAAGARVTHCAPRAEYAGAIAETDSGAWLVSARIGAGTHYALKLWKPGAAALQTLLARAAKILSSRSCCAAHNAQAPSLGLHDWSYANMLALDARLSREGDLEVAPASVRLETHGRSRPRRRYWHGAGGGGWFFLCETPADSRFALRC